VQVVWNDLHSNENGYYRTGIKFVNIPPDDMDKLRMFLNTLKSLEGPSESNIPSKLLKDLRLSNLGNFPAVPPKSSDED
jgi:hypothetical protein